MVKKITCGLTPESLEQAIQQLEQYSKGVERKSGQLIKALVERGKEIVAEELEDLVYSAPGEEYRTGDLKNSINGDFDPTTGTGYVRTDLPYAKYVEFGTGVIGQASPHPVAGEQGWQYNIPTEHKDEHGFWTYYNERTGRFHSTQGFRSRPFMYNAARRLQDEAKDIAKVVFKRDRH